MSASTILQFMQGKAKAYFHKHELILG